MCSAASAWTMATKRGCSPMLRTHNPRTSHGKTQKHIDATNDGVIGAPALRLFALVLKAFLGGKIGSNKAASDECDAGVPGVGGRHKVRKMMFCLAEAVRERFRQHLALAHSLTLHSDANKNRLLLLSQFCGADLQPRHGLLGTQSLDDDCSAAGITMVILRILRICARCCRGPP